MLVATSGVGLGQAAAALAVSGAVCIVMAGVTVLRSQAVRRFSDAAPPEMVRGRPLGNLRNAHLAAFAPGLNGHGQGVPRPGGVVAGWGVGGVGGLAGRLSQTPCADRRRICRLQPVIQGEMIASC